MGHLSPDLLVDLAEGTRPESRVPHLATCDVCRKQVADLRAMLATINVDVPEPSPLFWDHLSARVREAVQAEEARGPAWWRGRLSWTFAAAVSLAVVILAVSVTMRTTPDTNGVRSTGVASSETRGDVVVLAADDPSLTLLTDLAADLDWDRAADAGMTMEIGATERVVAELTDAERVELGRLLREAMSGSGV
jgi:hypothetical protein